MISVRSSATGGGSRRAATRPRPSRVLTVALAVLGVGGVLVAASSPLAVVEVRGASMSPTLCDGDVLLVLTGGWAGPPRTDDLIVLDDPARSGSRLVKRVVATPGVEVRIADGSLVRDGRRVAEPWADPATLPGVYSAPVVVPDGSVYVLGDNRELSVDSRRFGVVPRTDIEGRVLSRIATRCP